MVGSNFFQFLCCTRCQQWLWKWSPLGNSECIQTASFYISIGDVDGINQLQAAFMFSKKTPSTWPCKWEGYRWDLCFRKGDSYWWLRIAFEILTNIKCTDQARLYLAVKSDLQRCLQGLSCVFYSFCILEIATDCKIEENIQRGTLAAARVDE